jgi:hypothetical protein
VVEKSVADRTDEPLDPVTLGPAQDGQLNALLDRCRLDRCRPENRAALPRAATARRGAKPLSTAALDMAGRLVTTQYEFLRSVVRSADRTLRKPDHAKD